MTQIEIIKKYLADAGDWIPSWKLSKLATRWGFLGSGAERKARLLAERGLIERKRDGKYAYYRTKKSGIVEELQKLKRPVTEKHESQRLPF